MGALPPVLATLVRKYQREAGPDETDDRTRARGEACVADVIIDLAALDFVTGLQLYPQLYARMRQLRDSQVAHVRRAPVEAGLFESDELLQAVTQLMLQAEIDKLRGYETIDLSLNELAAGMRRPREKEAE